MRIAILYICTGKYSVFWHDFYWSCEKYFQANTEKHYFVFTDDKAIQETSFIHIIVQYAQGFPLDSLLRFKMFIGIKEQLKSFNYIFFFNANIQFVAPVTSEILPDIIHDGLTGVLHPGYLNSCPFWMPFERNKKSTAYMASRAVKYHYFLGGINGGIAGNYLEMVNTLQDNIQADLDKGITAFYHDESHINRYFADKNVLKLTPSYGYPEGWKLPYEPKILILDKVKHGGAYFDKLPRHSYLKRFKLFIKRLVAGILWYIK